MADNTRKIILRDKYSVPSDVLGDDQVTLRRWRIEDADALQSAAASSLPELKPWMPWAKNGYTIDDAKSFLTMTAAEWDAGKGYNWALIVDDEVVGSFGLMDPAVGDVGMGMGYWIATHVTGRGLATRAAGLLTRTAFGLGAVLVQIWHHVDNKKSRAIPERLGYKLLEEQASPKITEQGPHGIWQLDKQDH